MTCPQLYFAPGSCAFASLIALEEAGAVYQTRRIDLAAGEQRRAEFRALSPRGQVPTLVAEEVTIRENLAVLTYIAQRFPAAGLLPFESPALMGKSYEFLSWFATNLHVAVAQIWRTERFSTDDVAQAPLKAQGRIALTRALETFDAVASDSDGPWILESGFSVCDTLAPVAGRWARRLELELSDYAALATLVDRVNARPATERAVLREIEG